MIDKNWARWIFASLSKHFQDNRQGIDFFVEGEDQKLENSENYIEFRMNGPIFNEVSKNFWKIEVVVNILVVSKQNAVDIHTIHRNVGIVAEAFKTCIPIKKYGDSIDDSPTQVLGIMIRKIADKKDVNISHIGQVSADVKEMQSMVEAYYCMYLEI